MKMKGSSFRGVFALALSSLVLASVACDAAATPPPSYIRITGPDQVSGPLGDIEGECSGFPTDGSVSIELFLQDPVDRSKYWCVQRPKGQGVVFTEGHHWRVQGQFGDITTYTVFAVAVEADRVGSLPGCKELPGQNFVLADSEQGFRALLREHVYHNDGHLISEGVQVRRGQ